MVQQGPDPRAPRSLAEFAELPPTGPRRRAMRELVENEQRAQDGRDAVLVRPGFREHVEQMMRSRWGEPVIVLRLDQDVDLGFDVPGRRADGTVTGQRLVRRFFWNVARGVGGAAVVTFTLVNAGGAGNPFRREIRVRGPVDAMALELLDPLRGAKGPWLVRSPSHLAVVDTGPTYLDPADAPPGRVLWQAREPHCPVVSFRTRTISWPDGSTFTFPLLGRAEERHLRKFHDFPDVIHWHGRPATSPGGGRV